MSALLGVFLIAHGLVHLAIWLMPLQPDAPFDPRHSWLLGQIEVPARLLAAIAGAAFCLAGVLGIADAEPAAPTALAASAVSLILIALTFNPWLLLAIAIDVAIAIDAIG